MRFGEFLKEQREIKGVSKCKLSRLTGVTVTALSGYENLEHEPTVSVGEKICNALEVKFVLGNRG